MSRLAAVDFAGCTDEPGQFGASLDDEPRVDRDAVAADAGTRLQDVYPRMPVRHFDYFPDVESEMFADQRELVGVCDVDIAESVFDEFCHLGTLCICQDDLALTEDAVDLSGLLRARLVMPPTTLSFVTISIMIRPGSTRSGQWAMWMSGAPSVWCGKTRSGLSSAGH